MLRLGEVLDGYVGKNYHKKLKKMLDEFLEIICSLGFVIVVDFEANHTPFPVRIG